MSAHSVMTTIDPAHRARLNRMSFRAWRRGFKEADLILGPFADACAPSMSEAELEVFERLLEVPDQDLYAWIVGREPTPAEWRGPVMDRIQAFQAAGLHAGSR